MSKDTIYRQDAVDAINELHDKPNAWLDLAVEALEKLPSAEPERKGEWIITGEFSDCRYAKCNQCNVTQIFYYGKPLTNYCPNCGSYNGGEQGEN